MSDDDPLRSAFDGFRADALPDLQAPGVTDVRRRWIRRRAVQSGAAVAVVAVLTLTGVALAGPLSAEPEITDSASPATSPSPSATPSPSAGATKVRPDAGDQTPRKDGGNQGGKTCREYGEVDIAEPMTDGAITLAARVDAGDERKLCPGEVIRVFWASYEIDPGGIQRLFDSGTGRLDAGQPTVRLEVRLPSGDCRSWYVGAGSAEIRELIPPDGGGYSNVIDSSKADVCVETPVSPSST
ncbi:hypothetical protein [Phytohabitans aurantiacus]|jgi:hypothetical protein|uniref:Uncharacterized protein n=1 Tax=Phytohabitans aurantiacus TaxID=3016789 RepID=A0ABQ5QWY8_9ACTN|nr:hypothetical protein [Phytohabitans aurantiacus]GLH97845.1 hypothetical protein Pa4123_31200 [Phytohabitans aurantiacus]